MFGIDKIIEKIWEDIFKTWLEKATGRQKIILFICSIIFAAGFFWKNYILDYLDIISYLPKVVLVDEKDTHAPRIPITSELFDTLKETKKRLYLRAKQDTRDISNEIYTSWTTSQLIISFGKDRKKLGSIEKSNILNKINIGKAINCPCWAELKNSNKDFHLPFVAGWISSALALLNVPLESDVFDFIIKEQSSEGWWSMFPANTDRQYASTYATAWAVMGLKDQVERHLISGYQLQEANDAISKGVTWLSSEQKSAKWKNYPYLVNGSEYSESISGLVLHLLNRFGSNDVDYFNKKWIDVLPNRVVTIEEVEKPYIEILTPSGPIFDHFQQIIMPWMLIATVDAYRSGSFWQKAKALRWLEKVLADEGFMSSDSRMPWWRAESLIGINYIIRED